MTTASTTCPGRGRPGPSCRPWTTSTASTARCSGASCSATPSSPRCAGPCPCSPGGGVIEYGLGLYALDLPCGRFWGHDGGVFGMITQSLSSPDGSRQISVGLNRAKYQTVDENGQIVPHPIDAAFVGHLLLALCGPGQARTLSTPVTPFPADRLQLSR
ncbi:hypothetical protein ACFSTC_47610 [Nonomuraea ferruginea]